MTRPTQGSSKENKNTVGGRKRGVAKKTQKKLNCGVRASYAGRHQGLTGKSTGLNETDYPLYYRKAAGESNEMRKKSWVF